jgi:hypothetical protein
MLQTTEGICHRTVTMILAVNIYDSMLDEEYVWNISYVNYFIDIVCEFLWII